MADGRSASLAVDASAGEVVSRDPYRGREVFRAPVADAGQVTEAVARARAAADAWAACEPGERAEVLRRFADRVEADADGLAALLVAEVGKRRPDADGEVGWTALSARWYAEHPPRVHRVGGALVVPRPVGVVAAVTPWNVPLVTPAWKWLPALMAGNAVVWKPSELASGIAQAAHRHLRAAGAPADVMQVVFGGAETAQALCADERVDVLHFTGSEAAGRALSTLVAPRFVRCALEMSGLNPALVFPDADLDLAARSIAACGTALAGQKCTATRRVVVHEAVREPLLARLAAGVEALSVGDPACSDTDVGPLVAPAARARAELAVAEAVQRGASVVARASAPEHPALFPPTVLYELADADPLRLQELFAPVLTVEAFSDTDDAWRRANATPYGLSSAVYARDPAILAQAPGRLRTGVVALNRRGDDVALEAPFGGMKRSGNGRAEGGAYVYDAVTELQAIYES